MTSLSDISRHIAGSLLRAVPFADAASPSLPLERLLRLSLFQVSVGLTMVLLTGTLNRVMIVELGVPASLVAVMVALPLCLAPLRALIGFRSDTYKSFIGWRRVPYLAFGTMLTFGGLAIMPFALLNLTHETQAHPIFGQLAAGLAFLMAGAGVHITQTAGLALAADLTTDETRPRAVALLHVALLVGMVISALALGGLLVDLTPKKLIQVIQGTAVVVMLLNTIALWGQEPRRPNLTHPSLPRPGFWEAFTAYTEKHRPGRLLVAVALGAAAFGMQDVLLEPFGGEILGLSASQTTFLTALMAGGSLIGFAWAGRVLARGGDPYQLAGLGALVGVLAFAGVTMAVPFVSPWLLRIGSVAIGLGGGLFAVGTLVAAMAQSETERSGLALGAWGAVQATAAGAAMALGGIIRDAVTYGGEAGVFGAGLNTATLGYTVVFHLEILLLFAALVAIGPLYRRARLERRARRFGLAEAPG